MTATTISIANQKGGTGKSTTCIHTASYLARESHTVLMIDLDPQGNLSDLTKTEHQEGLHRLIIDNYHPDEVILDIPDGFHGGAGILQLLPGYVRTAIITLEMEIMRLKVDRIVEKFDMLKAIYDYILLDYPPTVSPMTPGSLMVSDWVLIPTQMNYLSCVGVNEFVGVMADYAGQHQAQILGILPTQTRPDTLEYSDRMAELKKNYGDLVWEYEATTRSTIWEEATDAALPVYVYQPNHKAAEQALAIGARVLAATQEIVSAGGSH